MLATPGLFRPNQSPLGAVLLPQAHTPVGHFPLPEGLSLARAESTFTGGPDPIDCYFHPRGNPKL